MRVHRERNPLWSHGRQPRGRPDLARSRLPLLHLITPVGGQLQDRVGSALVLSGAPVYGLVSTAAGAAADFTGGGSAYSLEGAPAPVTFTMEALVQVGTVQQEPVCGYGQNGSPGTVDRQILINADGTVQGYLFDGQVKLAISSTTLVTGGIYHLTFVSDGSTIGIYVNGILNGSTAAGSGYSGYTQAQFCVGAQVFGGGGSGLTTTPSNMLLLAAVWAGVMTPAEIAARARRPWDVFAPAG